MAATRAARPGSVMSRGSSAKVESLSSMLFAGVLHMRPAKEPSDLR
jgi:hypothetical protein